MTDLQSYINDIKNDKVVVGKKIKQQYAKLEYYLNNKDKNYIENFDKSREYFRFDEDKAIRLIKFIESFCVHVKGEKAGQLIKLEKWQKALIMTLYGFVNVKTGYRKYRRLHLYVARKNGKTLLAACLIIYELMLGGEMGAEIYSGATKLDQAKIAWNMARTMIKMNLALNKRIHMTVSGVFKKPFKDSFYKPICKESKKLDGLNTYVSHIDELHAITDKNIVDVMWDGTKARKQPIEFITTTMGTERQSTFDEVYEYDNNVVNGVFKDDRLLVFCYELDAENEWDKIDLLYKANPNLGISLGINDLYEEMQKAKNDIAKKSNFLCKSCNVKQNSALAWLTYDEIINKKVVDLTKFKEPIVIGGFDLSKTGDMTAFTTLLFDTESNKIIADTMYWITNKYLKRVKKVPFDIWIKKGYVKISGEENIDYHDIVEYLLEKVELGWIYQGIGYDPWSATYLVNELESIGFAKNYILKEVKQGAQTLSVPMQELGADLKMKKLIYQNNPVTMWCFTNVELIKDRNGNFLPTKGNYERKIDGMATILDCYALYTQNPEYYMTGGR